MSAVQYLIKYRREQLLKATKEPSLAPLPLALWNSFRKETRSMVYPDFELPHAGKYVNGSVSFLGMRIYIGRLK